MSKLPYFPREDEIPNCSRCDFASECHSKGKFQRNKRNFSYTSGRCPRLPDIWGKVDKSQEELYLATMAQLLFYEEGER